MCYGVKARTEMALRVARVRGDKEAEEKLGKFIAAHPGLELHYASAFSHPALVVYTDAAPHDPQLSYWGLVPGWVKDDAGRLQLWNRTLNARGETIFEKPAFRESARHRRCIVHVEGFYEHHHMGRHTYPYFIHLKDRPQFALAGLWDRWKDPDSGKVLQTFSIVTCEGNDLLRRIHNNPKMEGPRMPVILAAAEEDMWLAPVRTAADEAAINALIRPYPANAMTAHPVRHLLGRGGTGNSPGASDPYDHPELLLADPLA